MYQLHTYFINIHFRKTFKRLFILLKPWGENSGPPGMQRLHQTINQIGGTVSTDDLLLCDTVPPVFFQMANGSFQLRAIRIRLMNRFPHPQYRCLTNFLRHTKAVDIG